MALPRRAASATGGAPLPPMWEDPYFKGDYPNLHAFLNDTKYDDGTARLTGGLVAFCKMGSLTFAVNDNDRNLVAYVNAPTWAEALEAIDKGIADDSLPWKARTPKQSHGQPPF